MKAIVNGKLVFPDKITDGVLLIEDGKIRAWEFAMSEPEFSRTTDNPFAKMETTELEIETDGKNKQHYGVMNAFAAAILRGEPLIANGEEGINGLMLSNAMHLSAWTESKVSLPIDEELYYEELMKRVSTSKEKDLSEVFFADTDDVMGSTKS